jgi:fructuronate reductase
MRYVGGVDELGQVIDVRDPLAGRLRDASDSADTPEGKVAALLGVRDVFPAELAEQLIRPVTKAAIQLWTKGTLAAIEEGAL